MYLFSFLEIKFQNDAHLKKKKLFWTYFLHFSVTKEKTKKIISTYLTCKHTYIHTYMYFAQPINFFCLPRLILQKLQIYHVSWYGFSPFLFGVTPGVDSYSLHFGAISNKMVNKF